MTATDVRGALPDERRNNDAMSGFGSLTPGWCGQRRRPGLRAGSGMAPPEVRYGGR